MFVYDVEGIQGGGKERGHCVFTLRYEEEMKKRKSNAHFLLSGGKKKKELLFRGRKEG